MVVKHQRAGALHTHSAPVSPVALKGGRDPGSTQGGNRCLRHRGPPEPGRGPRPQPASHEGHQEEARPHSRRNHRPAPSACCTDPVQASSAERTFLKQYRASDLETWPHERTALARTTWQLSCCTPPRRARRAQLLHTAPQSRAGSACCTLPRGAGRGTAGQAFHSTPFHSSGPAPSRGPAGSVPLKWLVLLAGSGRTRL